MKAQTKSTLIAVILCAICAGTVILCEIFMKGRSAVLYYTAVSVLLVCPVVYCAADKEKYKHFSRTVLVVAIIAVSVIVCYVLYYTTGLSERFSDFDALKAYIRGSGFWGIAIFIGLTVFQVVVLPIPEAVTILLGVAIYGATMSLSLIHI